MKCEIPTNPGTIISLMPGSNGYNGTMFYVPMSYIQIQAKLDVSPLAYVPP